MVTAGLEWFSTLHIISMDLPLECISQPRVLRMEWVPKANLHALTLLKNSSYEYCVSQFKNCQLPLDGLAVA